MAQITFNISATDIQRLIDATCIYGGYINVFIDGTANIETKAQFTQRTWREKMAALVRSVEENQKKEAYIASNPVTAPVIS